jgi:hypothetical protein
MFTKLEEGGGATFFNLEISFLPDMVEEFCSSIASFLHEVKLNPFTTKIINK